MIWMGYYSVITKEIPLAEDAGETNVSRLHSENAEWRQRADGREDFQWDVA